MAASHSTSKMLASMIGKGDRNTAKSATVSDVMSRETSDEFDELQPKVGVLSYQKEEAKIFSFIFPLFMVWVTKH